MATNVQPYPRIHDEKSKEHGLLEVSKLVGHQNKLSHNEMFVMIRGAIEKANQKSSRESISIPDNAASDELQKAYRKAGKDLFGYFKKYCDDPASTAHQLKGKHYREVGIEQFRNRMLQKGRMNSGWRYQYLLLECASRSRRFKGISDLGQAEADFNAVIDFIDPEKAPLSLYVSVKNRRNTLGGQDWPQAINALERMAKNDKNRIGPYCCVFGIAIDRGQRHIKISQKTGQPHSINTEVWLSDFLWPFFANYSYEEMMGLVLDVLLKHQEADFLPSQINVPIEVLEVFGEFCGKEGLVNNEGRFDDPHKLVKFFVK